MKYDKYTAGLWLAITVLIVVLGRIIEGIDIILRAGQVYSILVVVILYRYKSWEVKGLLVCAVFSILFFVNLIAYENIYLSGFTPIGIFALSLLYYRIFRSNTGGFVYIWYVALLLSCIYVFVMAEALNYNTNNIVRGSRNHITTLLLPMYAIIFVATRYSEDQYDKMGKVFFLGVLVALILVLYSGRTGVLSAFFIILTSVFSLLSSRHWLVTLLTFGSLVLVSSVIIPDVSGTIEASRGLQRLNEEQVTENIRFLLWAEAVGYMMDSNYALGVPLGFWSENLPLGLTVHNSYLEIYGYYGWAGITIALALIISMFYKVFRADPLVSVLVLALLLRSFFDTTLLDLVLGSVYIFITIVTIRLNREAAADNRKPYS